MFPPMTSDDQENPICVQSIGSIVRKSKQRVSNLTVDSTDRVLCCHVNQRDFSFLFDSTESFSISVLNHLLNSFEYRLSIFCSSTNGYNGENILHRFMSSKAIVFPLK